MSVLSATTCISFKITKISLAIILFIGHSIVCDGLNFNNDLSDHLNAAYSNIGNIDLVYYLNIKQGLLQCQIYFERA